MNQCSADCDSGLLHHGLVYDGAEEFLAAAVPFFADGVRDGDAMLAVARAHNNAMLMAALGAVAERIEFVDADRWYDAPGRALAALRGRIELRNGSGRLRALGEPVWPGRLPLETHEWIRYDNAINAALAGAPAWLVCAYDAGTLPAAVVADARNVHPALASAGGIKTNDEYLEPARFFARNDDALPDPPTTDVQSIGFSERPGPVRRFVTQHALRLGLPADRLDDLVLAVNEICTNAIRHGGGTGRIRLWREPDRLLCEVTDAGAGLPAARAMGFLPGGPLDDHGHGLWLSHQLCDLMQVRTGRSGTTVRMHMRI